MSDIRDAHLWANIAEMWSEVATLEGMKAANVEREKHGYALAWPEDAFEEVANRLMGIANRIEEVYR